MFGGPANFYEYSLFFAKYVSFASIFSLPTEINSNTSNHINDPNKGLKMHELQSNEFQIPWLIWNPNPKSMFMFPNAT